MVRQAAFLVFAAAAGVLVGALGVSLRPGDAAPAPAATAAPSNEPVRQRPPGSPGAADLAAAVDSLTEILNAEINERRILTEQVQQLKSELLSLKRLPGVHIEPAPVDGIATDGEAEDAVAHTREARLAAAGFTPEQMQLIDSAEIEAQMAGIALDDRARREGWINTPRYIEEARSLPTGPESLRAVFGDELYDRYLVASGFPNRVAVGSVIDGSPAADAGFLVGDVIVSYAGETVYSARQLIELRSSGQLGEPVAVEIRRKGQPLQLTIPRGPMGLSAMPALVDPDAGDQ